MKIDEIVKILKDEHTSLQNRFIMACVWVDVLNKPLTSNGVIDTDMQNSFYKYYKQGSLGDECRGPCPSMFRYVEYTKWNVWSEVEGISKEEAQEEYLKLSLHALEQIKDTEEAIKIAAAMTSAILKKKCEEKEAVFQSERAKHTKGSDKTSNIESPKQNTSASSKPIPGSSSNASALTKDIPLVKDIPSVDQNPRMGTQRTYALGQGEPRHQGGVVSVEPSASIHKQENGPSSSLMSSSAAATLKAGLNGVQGATTLNGLNGYHGSTSATPGKSTPPPPFCVDTWLFINFYCLIRFIRCCF